jgi:hypothetical protein
VLTPTSIQAPHTLPGNSHETASLSRLGSRDARFVDIEHKRNLLAHNASLNERQDVTQEPSQISAPDRPFEVTLRTFRRRFSHPHSPAPSTNVEINNFTIRIRQRHARLRKVSRATATKCHGTFAIEASSSPTQLPHRKLLEGAFSFVFKTSPQTLRIALLVARNTMCCSADPTSSRAVVGSDIEILRRSSMAVYTMCLVSRRQSHIKESNT